MKRIYKYYCKGQEIIVGVIFVSIVILIFIAAFFRQFSMPLIWADDIAKLLFSWAAFLGADIAMRYSKLVGVDIVVNKFPKKVVKILQIITFSIIIIFLTFLTYHGTRLSIASVERDFQTLSNVSYSYVTASLPVASVMMILTASVKIVRLIKNFKNDDYNILKHMLDEGQTELKTI